MTNVPFRIGLGVDHHRLLDQPLNSHDRPLTLGGFAIPDQTVSLESNCDGDIIIHALCNALSTAVGGGSLSPLTDPLCQNGVEDSSQFVAPFLAKITQAGYQIGNLSISVEAARPKLEAFGPAIKKRLAALTKISPDQIGLAFTTGEGLTACGQGEGIYAQVICLLTQITS